MSEQLLSTAIEVFCHRLEEDGVDDVSLELVRDRWIPEVVALETKLEAIEQVNLKARIALGRVEKYASKYAREVTQALATAQKE